MEILPLILLALFVFVSVRVARLALDPSTREASTYVLPAETVSSSAAS